MQVNHAIVRGGWIRWGVGGLSAAVIGAALFGGIVAAKKHHEPTGPDAFLHYQVDSTDELVTALRENEGLRRRYARHFGIPENRVVDFVKNALVPYRLPESRKVTVYGVTRSGMIYGVHTRLKKGTKVWATRSGVPVLRWACANPLIKVLPGTQLALAPRPTRPRPRPVVANVPKLASAVSNELPPAPLPLTAPVAPPINTNALAAPMPPAIGVATAPAPAIAAVSHGGPGIGSILIPIGIIIGTTIGHTGGGGSNVTPPPVIIPEPGTLSLILGAALPAIGITTRRRRRQRRNQED